MKRVRAGGKAGQSGTLLTFLRGQAGFERQTGLATAVNQEVSYSSPCLKNQISDWERGIQLPGDDRIEAVYRVLREQGISDEKIALLVKAVKIDRERRGRDLSLDQQIAVNALDIANDSGNSGMSRQKAFEILLILQRHSPEVLTDEQQAALIELYLRLGVEFYSEFMKRMAMGGTVTKEEFNHYYCAPGRPQLGAFTPANHLFQRGELIEHLPIPNEKVDFRVLSKGAQEAAYFCLRDMLANKSPAVKTIAIHHLSLLPFLVPQDERNRLVSQLKDIIVYGTKKEDLWQKAPCVQGVYAFEREKAGQFLLQHQRDLDEMTKLRTEFFREQIEGHLFNKCMQLLQWHVQNRDPVMRSEHAVIYMTGEFTSVVGRIATESGLYLPFNELDKAVNMVWEQEDWLVAKSLSLDLIQSTKPYFTEADKCRADGLLQKLRPQIPKGFENLLDNFQGQLE